MATGSDVMACHARRLRRAGFALAVLGAAIWAGCADDRIVDPAKGMSLTVTPAQVSLGVGDTVQLAAVLRNANGIVASAAPVHWSSADPLVVKVDAAGMVVGVQPGSAAVTATNQGVSDTAMVTVMSGPAGLIVSNPLGAAGEAAGTSGAGVRASRTAASDLVYVSLPPGSVPGGGLATVHHRGTGQSVAVAMAGGGFDPVAIAAQAGDVLKVEIQVSGGGAVSLSVTVPASRPPIVVRTDPPRRKVDVPLNAVILIVLSEPVDPASAGSLRLLRDGAPVSGRVVVSADGLRATFEPDQLLEANTQYVISIETGLTDLGGERLEAAVTAEFTTGTAVVQASVAATPPALVVHPAVGLQRTLDFHASRFDDGTIAGTFNIFYPETGFLILGRVTCFSIAGDSAAWVAGTVEIGANPGQNSGELGWLVVDRGNGFPPDGTSLAYALVSMSPQEFCATMPTSHPRDGAIQVLGLIGGDVVVNPDGPPPPPPPPPPGGMSRIASVGTHEGGIKVVNADGSGGRVLTTDRDWSPAWSPDGTRLAFDRERSGGGADIYVMLADGSGVTRLTDNGAFDTDPAWSRDGNRIAFTRDGVLHVMNADGTGGAPLSIGGGELNPSWSPNGATILVNRWDPASGGWRIWALRTDGSGGTALTFGPGDDYHPRWSPDGTLIAFARAVDPFGGEGLYVMNADGSGLRRLTQGINGPPAWSPDGTRIAFEMFGLNSIRLDGSGLRTIGNGFDPTWSPTGAMPPAPTPFRSLVMVSGDGQTGAAGSALAESLRVRLVRDDGAPAAGVVVRWNAWGDGPVYPHPSVNTTITGADGTAAVEGILGSVGPARFRAALTDGTGRIPEVVFTASVPPAPTRLQFLRTGSALATPNSVHEYVVAVFDAGGEPIAGVPVTWTLTAGDGTLAPALGTTTRDPDFGIPTSRSVHTVGASETPAVVTASVPTPGVAPATDSVTVVTTLTHVRCNGYASATLTVPAGRTVAWVFNTRCGVTSGRPHNVTFEDDPSLSSPTLGVGHFTRTFTGPPRTIRFRCTRHSTDFNGPAGEVGVVIVQ